MFFVSRPRDHSSVTTVKKNIPPGTTARTYHGIPRTWSRRSFNRAGKAKRISSAEDWKRRKRDPPSAPPALRIQPHVGRESEAIPPGRSAFHLSRRGARDRGDDPEL